MKERQSPKSAVASEYPAQPSTAPSEIDALGDGQADTKVCAHHDKLEFNSAGWAWCQYCGAKVYKDYASYCWY